MITVMGITVDGDSDTKVQGTTNMDVTQIQSAGIGIDFQYGVGRRSRLENHIHV